MPKAYTDIEKAEIIRNLKREALVSLKKYGVKKTTVDNLVDKVHIPKGTFYLFYKSKEALLFDSIQTVHDDIQLKFLKDIEKHKDTLTSNELTNILINVLNETEEAGLTHIMAHGDFDLILKKLPNEVIEEHLKKDHVTIGALAEYIPSLGERHIEAFEGALRAIFLACLHEREIGVDIFKESIKILIKGVVNQLMDY